MMTLVQLQADQEAAALRLAAVSDPSRWKVLGEEAHRRAAVIADACQQTALGLGTMTPLAAGYRSVRDDVIAGRLR